ncbi:MAG TPA: hypothetical protein VGH23_05160 [Rhizomicrobium sp.]|jgi:uncharacterized protein (PEP-CTERM system associated)
MSAVRMTVFKRALVCSAAFTLFGAGDLARAQILDGSTFGSGLPAGPIVSPGGGSVGPLITPYGSPPSSSSSPSMPQLDYSQQGKNGTLARTALMGAAPQGFQWGANALFSESYITNSSGTGQSEPDYISMLGLSSNVHDHAPRLSLDANYNFSADFYAKNTEPTQISNYLQALGTASVIPDYLSVNLRAFAQPVITSNLGAITAGDRVVPGSYNNTYGYFGSPDLTFKLGNFASSETMPSYGQIFFTTPPGTTTANTLPGVFGPDNTTMRSLTESISSGSDFERLNWRLIGLYSETDSAQSLLTEKTGVANIRYAIDYEWSLLFTGGYDAIKDSIPLIQNISGPVALAGFGLTLGNSFAFQIEAGERYNKFSLTSSLRYAVTPTSQLSASVNDYIQTPEGQLLNNLTGLTALANGTLTSSQNAFANGAGSSLGSFNLQSPDNPALDQFVSRYQIGNISWVEQLGRNSISLAIYGTRRTYLVSGFTGPPVDVSWGSSLNLSRSLSPLLTGSLGASYNTDQEFGGEGKTIAAQGGLYYSLGRTTNIYLTTSYVTRLSSPSLQTLSPLSGNVSDFMATVGISHTL